MFDNLKSLFWGLLVLAGGLLFWYSLVGNPFDEWALIKRGVTTTASITDTWEDGEDDDRGKTHFFHGFTYTFQLPNGQMVTGHTRNLEGRLPLNVPRHIEVRYLPDSPAVSRIKDDISPTISDLLLRKFLVGGILLAMFLSPGVFLLYSAVRDQYQPVPDTQPITKQPQS